MKNSRTLAVSGGKSNKQGTRTRVTGSMPKPSFMADFVRGRYSVRGEDKTYESIITTTRGSTGNVVGPNGLIVSVAANIPRFDYDPVTLKPLGLLTEEARTNIVLQSADLTKWVAQQTTVTPSTVVAPDGTTTAILAISNSVQAWHQVRSQVFQVTQGVTYSASVYVKSAGLTTTRLTFENAAFFSTAHAGRFNLATGTVMSGVDARIVPAGDGWYRISVVSTALATGTTIIALGLGGDIVSGNDQDGLILFGPQVEAGGACSSYNPTITTSVARAADLIRVMDIVPWFNQTQGTLLLEFEPGVIGIGGVAAGVWLSQVSVANSSVAVRKNNTQGGINGVISSKTGAVQLNAAMSTKLVPLGQTCKAALSYDANSAIMCLDGQPAMSKDTIELPTPELMTIGSTGNGQQFTNGHVKRILYFPQKLTESQLRALTK